ncbi:MAG: hypothetical protein M1832_002844 [Thelocarpon impressellum]|nr:MAG: hypothetical protein M1832_002844 [Thelocarpon impressellum]
MVSHPLSGNDETNFLSRKRNLARTTKEPDERDPSRSSKRARVADLLEGSRTTGPGNTEGGSGSQPLDLTANTPETRSKARKLAGPQAQPRGGPLPGERPVEVQTHAENAVGKPWDGPVVYPPQGERKRQTTVDHSDLPRLDEGEFLNDNLISFYLRYLEHELEQTQPDVAERVYIFNTFFYERLTKTERGKRGINYQAVQKWTSKIDIFGYDFLVVPINEKPGPLEAPETREVPRTTTEAPLGIDTELDSTEQGVSRMTIVQAPSDVQPDSRSSKSASTPPLGGGPEASVEQVGGLEDADVEWPPEDEAPPEFAASQIRPTPKVTVNLSENKPDNPQDATTSKTEAAGLAASPSRRKGKRKSLPPLKKYNPDETVIITLDSLGVPHPVTTRNLKLYLQAEGASKRNIEIDTQDISGVSASRQIPQQDNFCDCGLFLLGYMRKFLEDPMGVVTRLLQREMDPDRDWPEMNPSQMRREIRNILIGLGRDQALRRKEDRKAVARKNGRYHDRSATKGTAKVVVKEQGLASASEDAVVLGKSRMDEGTAEKCPEPRETGPGAAAKPDENVQAETSVPNAPEGDDDNQDDSLVITDSRPVPKERKLAEDVFTEAVRPPPSSPVRPRRTPRYSTPEQVMKRGNAPSRSNSPLTPQMYSSPKARRELGLTRLVVEMPVMEGEEEL